MAGLMDALNDFGKGLAYNSTEAREDRAFQRALSQYEKKQQLANSVALDLERRKMEMAQEFPEVGKLFNTNFGVVLQSQRDGKVKEVFRDEDYRNAILGNKMAPMVRAEAAAAEVPSKIAKNMGAANRSNASASESPSRIALNDARAAAEGKSPEAKSISMSDWSAAIKEAKARNSITDLFGKQDMSKWDAMSDEEKNAAAMKIIQDRNRANEELARGAVGAQAPQDKPVNRYLQPEE